MQSADRLTVVSIASQTSQAKSYYQNIAWEWIFEKAAQENLTAQTTSRPVLGDGLPVNYNANF
jgi:hypothetical protein